jgi:hypothetical protein
MKLRRGSPFINGTTYCGMLAENPEKPQHFGPDFIEGCGPYYDSRQVDEVLAEKDAEIARLTFESENLRMGRAQRMHETHALELQIERLRADIARYVYLSRHMVGGGDGMDHVLRWRREYPEALRVQPASPSADAS